MNFRSLETCVEFALQSSYLAGSPGREIISLIRVTAQVVEVDSGCIGVDGRLTRIGRNVANQFELAHAQRESFSP